MLFSYLEVKYYVSVIKKEKKRKIPTTIQQFAWDPVPARSYSPGSRWRTWPRRGPPAWCRPPMSGSAGSLGSASPPRWRWKWARARTGQTPAWAPSSQTSPLPTTHTHTDLFTQTCFLPCFFVCFFTLCPGQLICGLIFLAIALILCYGAKLGLNFVAWLALNHITEGGREKHRPFYKLTHCSWKKKCSSSWYYMSHHVKIWWINLNLVHCSGLGLLAALRLLFCKTLKGKLVLYIS